MIDATSFADVEDALVTAADPLLDDVMVTNETPPIIPAKLVTVAHAGGGTRDWGEASVNVGVNIYAETDEGCRQLVQRTLNAFATISNDLIEHVRVPSGGVPVPGQTPPFHRYLAVTVWLRGQSAL